MVLPRILHPKNPSPCPTDEGGTCAAPTAHRVRSPGGVGHAPPLPVPVPDGAGGWRHRTIDLHRSLDSLRSLGMTETRRHPDQVRVKPEQHVIPTERVRRASGGIYGVSGRAALHPEPCTLHPGDRAVSPAPSLPCSPAFRARRRRRRRARGLSPARISLIPLREGR